MTVWVAVICLCCGILVIWMWRVARHVVWITPGEEIEPRPGQALLLVDLQETCWQNPCYDAQTRIHVEAAIAREVTLAQYKDQPIIALQLRWTGIGHRLWARLTSQSCLCQERLGVAVPQGFQKTADHLVARQALDGFENGELDTILRVLRVGSLRIVGRDGTGAVARTAQAALNRGFSVTLVKDAIASKNRAEFDTVKTALNEQGARLN